MKKLQSFKGAHQRQIEGIRVLEIDIIWMGLSGCSAHFLQYLYFFRIVIGIWIFFFEGLLSES